MSLVKDLIAEQLFGSFIKLKHSKTGQEVLIPKFHWLAIKDGYGGKPLIQTDAVLPQAVHLYEASRVLHEASTMRIVDFADNREWIEQEEK